MNLSEFKAWLRGFEHRFQWGRPSAKQWAEIRKAILNLEPEPPTVVIVTKNDTRDIRGVRFVTLDAETYAALRSAKGGEGDGGVNTHVNRPSNGGDS